MNNTSRYLIYVSLTSLVIAIIGGLWLVWHTIEEGRQLERKNRELQASLEASRIRVENFCEYPSDVLCRVDERSGTVAGALPGVLPGMEELVGKPMAQQDKEDMPLLPEISPAKALENVKKVAQAQSTVDATIEKAASKAEEKAPELELPQPPAAPKAEATKPEIKAATPTPAPAIAADKADKPASPALPAEADQPKEAPADIPAAPAPVEEKKAEESQPAQIAVQEESKAEPSTPPAALPSPEAKASPAQPVYKQEFSGKLTEIIQGTAKPTVGDKATPKAAPAPKKSATVATTKQAEAPRMSWSRVEHDGDIFAFTITGAGESLKAKGNLLANPWRYELELDGIFEVRNHTGVANRLVKGMKVLNRNGKSVIVFSLKAKPYKCSVHTIDKRTVSVRIR